MNEILMVEEVAEEIGIGEALGISLLGISIVFIVLVLLMAIIFVMSKVIRLMNKKDMKNKEVVLESAPVAPPAKGSCGDLTLVKVSERDAAMIMAIVADQLKTPINELRFISIKEAE